jgi:phosphate transport system protein
MPRKFFDRKLRDLNQSMTEMGAAVDGRIGMTIEALRTLDRDTAAEVVAGDEEINAQEHAIEQTCMNLLALQQPIAGDLRGITACLKIITDMERVADQCADICDIIAIGEIRSNSMAVAHVLSMLEAARGMFTRAMDVFLSRDIEAARAVCAEDDTVDGMFSKIVLEICGGITENPQTVMREVDLMFITKYVERMADHATNIAEWVIYRETGEHPDLNDSYNH